MQALRTINQVSEYSRALVIHESTTMSASVPKTGDYYSWFDGHRRLTGYDPDIKDCGVETFEMGQARSLLLSSVLG